MRIADELQVDCPVFYVDNVAEYARKAHPEDGSMPLAVHDLPCLTPAFKRVFFEYLKKWPDGLVAHYGFLVETILRDSLAANEWERIIAVTGYERTNGDTRFRGMRGGDLAQSTSRLIIWLDRDGRMISVADEATNSGPETWFDGDCGGTNVGMMTMIPALLAMSFMHCKNVRHVEGVTPPKLAKALARRGRKAHIKYYILEIDPMREVLRREGKSETEGLARALHICRGHFKDYRQSGLFGKIKGIFWWDSMVKGTPERGQVVKDYAVKAPAEETRH